MSSITYSIARPRPHRPQNLPSLPTSSNSAVQRKRRASVIDNTLEIPFSFGWQNSPLPLLTERRGISHCRQSRGRQNRHRLEAVRRGGRRRYRPTALRRRRGGAGRSRSDGGGLGRRQHGLLLVRVVQTVLREMFHLGDRGILSWGALCIQSDA